MSIQISGPCAPADGSVTAAKINSGNAGDGQVLTADGTGGAAWEAVPTPVPSSTEMWLKIVFQGESAPLVTVLGNTTPFALGSVSRSSVGIYKVALNGATPGDVPRMVALVQNTYHTASVTPPVIVVKALYFGSTGLELRTLSGADTFDFGPSNNPTAHVLLAYMAT